ncbi:MAG: hypothetical protein IJ783_11380, partial [Kiritimatiellae bacterium]|nr:hypothetical protein [Kiritimatiellia bacterium]
RAPDVLAALAVAAVPALLLCASAWHSWTADYQPQGRYLFASNVAWAALGALAPARGGAGRRERLSSAVLDALVALGLVSFLFCALVPISFPGLAAGAPAEVPAAAAP